MFGRWNAQSDAALIGQRHECIQYPIALQSIEEKNPRQLRRRQSKSVEWRQLPRPRPKVNY